MTYEKPKMISIEKTDLLKLVQASACSYFFCFVNGYCNIAQFACADGYDIDKCDPLNPPEAAHGTYPDWLLLDNE